MAAESNWRRRISNVSESVFPGISQLEKRGPGPQSEVISSLPLQMALYFNVYFFPVWLISTGVMLAVKVDCLSSLYRFIAVTVTIATSVIEPLRIYLGYMGNLQEKIPEAAAFWMLSILLQLPLHLFLVSSSQLLQQPLEYTVQAIMLTLLLSQLFVGYFALRKAARYQAHRYHNAQVAAQVTGKDNPGYQHDSG